MTDDTKAPLGFAGTLTRADYLSRLRNFDAAVCEAHAVSQATGGRLESPAVGYSTHVFGRICAHAGSMICAAPLSRWVRRDFESWDVAAVASHARSILEGYILFFYLSSAPDDLDVQRAYVQVMHLYDCCKRIKILPHVLSSEDIEGLKEQAQEIRKRLESIQFFRGLDPKLKKDLLAGRHMMITPQKDVIAAAGIEQDTFDFFWNYFSQYTHVLSFTFYRVEPNGRGTGLENGFDRDALGMALGFSTDILIAATDKMVAMFPDAIEVRQGTGSKFAPGPRRNLPKALKMRGR